MTALTKYDRLEAEGLWRLTSNDQRRNVIVSIGDATLVIIDSQERPLAHWSLAAVSRHNPGKYPAIYNPDGDSEEQLELAEAEKEMILAIEKLLLVIDRGRPKPGRLRLVILTGIFVNIIALAIFWVPNAVKNYALRIVPSVKRYEIGLELMNQLSSFTGDPCENSLAKSALFSLSQHILGDPTRLKIVANGIKTSINLPGGFVLLRKEIVEDFEDPDVVAGFVLAEKLRSDEEDDLKELLDFAGTFGVFQLITTGKIPSYILQRYSEYLLLKPSRPINNQQLINAFRNKRLRAAPYAYALDLTGEKTFQLIESDEFSDITFEPSLTDANWVRLQGICGG